ncbi:MAG: hypothetical protein KKD38_01540 [Candidatus Delongbacteria bacterium]|nr:hypothetical protein [Candidatus Delongbacteria bacterium]MCG2760121.1 hypothetical protein [Candidatus Delongbacteria bacterium]
MIGNAPQKKIFSYTPVKSLRKDEKKPLRERMRFSSFSSQERKPYKRKMIYLIILLLLISGFILYHGFRSSTVNNFQLNENELERVNR